MKKKELKTKIREAFESEAPNLLPQIEESCQDVSQIAPISASGKAEKRICYGTLFKRIIAIAACFLIFISGITMGYFVKEDDLLADKVETYVYLDVNPSIELQMNEIGKVISCNAGNEDAEAVLSGLVLEGVDMNTALTAIVGSMYINGYLSTDSNSILVSVDSRRSEVTELLNGITEKINTIFEKSGMECSIIAQGIQTDNELKARAEENGVSVGKMFLVDKMIESIEDFSKDDTGEMSNMSIKELSLIYSTRAKGEEDPFDNDITTGEVGGYLAQEEALSTLLTATALEIEEIETYEIRAKLQHMNEKRQMIYYVSIKLYGDDTIYQFEVDCSSGEVLKIDSSLPTRQEPDKKPDEEMPEIEPGPTHHVKTIE